MHYKNREKKWTIISLVFFIIGLLSIIYYLYDLKYPNHFVGDMYGLELMVRGFILSIAALILFIGLILMLTKKNKNQKISSLIGFWLIIFSSSVLIFMSVKVSLSRHKDEIRKTYNLKPVDELIRIATEERDQYAIYALIAKKDSTAVPPLCEILFDEKQDLNIRMESAHALSQIGGKGARNALDKAMVEIKNVHLLETIQFAQKSISKNGNN
jgi:hypothetical protein